MDFDPELLQAILAGGNQSDQMDPDITRLKGLADRLRAGSGNKQGRMLGSVYVAPTGLETLANTYSGMMGGQAEQMMGGMQKQQAGIRGDQNQRVLEALIRQRQMQAAQGQGPAQQGQGSVQPQPNIPMNGGAQALPQYPSQEELERMYRMQAY
jgi:hypothetical protein